MNQIKNQDVAEKYESYPIHVKEKLLFLRYLILEVALEANITAGIEETLKWGEPSYVSKTGSTVRINWKSSTPTKYMMYFNCKTKLIDTFKEVYGAQFEFEGNRAIVFNIHDEPLVEELKNCILLSLNYHKIKHLPLLGL